MVFDVISNDSGFTHLVSYINGMGRACRQVLIATKNHLTDPGDSAQKLIQALKLNKKAKPKRIAALRNHIAATLKIRVDDGAIQSHINELECAGVLTVSDNDDIQYL